MTLKKITVVWFVSFDIKHKAKFARVEFILSTVVCKTTTHGSKCEKDVANALELRFSCTYPIDYQLIMNEICTITGQNSLKYLILSDVQVAFLKPHSSFISGQNISTPEKFYLGSSMLIAFRSWYQPRNQYESDNGSSDIVTRLIWYRSEFWTQLHSHA